MGSRSSASARPAIGRDRARRAAEDPGAPGLVFDFLPVAWSTIQHYGVEVGGLRYNGPVPRCCGNQTSPFTGAHAGKWPVRYDTDDVSRVYFQDPADSAWHELAWEHAQQVAVPFSAETPAYARRLGAGQGLAAEAAAPPSVAAVTEARDARTARPPAAMTTVPASWTQATTITPTRSRCCRNQHRAVHRRGTGLEPVGQVRLVRDGRGRAPHPAAAAGRRGDSCAPGDGTAPR